MRAAYAVSRAKPGKSRQIVAKEKTVSAKKGSGKIDGRLALLGRFRRVTGSATMWRATEAGSQSRLQSACKLAEK